MKFDDKAVDGLAKQPPFGKNEHYFVLGVQGQQDKCFKGLELLADYCGEHISKDVWTLVKHRTEAVFDIPEAPAGTLKTTEKDKWKLEVQEIMAERKAYKKDKGKAFIIG